jgi:hypothetical protein
VASHISRSCSQSILLIHPSLVTRPSTQRGGSGRKCKLLAGTPNGSFQEHFGWCRSPAGVKLKSKSKVKFLELATAADPSFPRRVVPCLHHLCPLMTRRLVHSAVNPMAPPTFRLATTLYEHVPLYGLGVITINTILLAFHHLLPLYHIQALLFLALIVSIYSHLHPPLTLFKLLLLVLVFPLNRFDNNTRDDNRRRKQS